MDKLLKNNYEMIIIIIIIAFIVYYHLIQPLIKNKENYYSKCCPINYPDLIYDWMNKPTCYDKRKIGTDPIPKCLPPNFLDISFVSKSKKIF
jgi:hypothetical protein